MIGTAPPAAPLRICLAGTDPFGAAIDLKGNVWLASYGSKAIAVFDKDGKPVR